MNWRQVLRWLAVAALPLCFGLSVDRQGLDLAEDGRWLYAASRLSALHEELRVADAPGRYLLLRASFALAGESARALDFLQAALAALLALLLFALLRWAKAGAWAWSAPIAVAALGPVTPTAPLLVALALALRWRRVWTAALFALALIMGIQIAALGLGLVALDAQRPRRWQPAFVGIALGLLLLSAFALLAGRPALWQDALVDPGLRWASALRGGAAWQWWESLRFGAYPRTPFAELQSGENLSALLPGHGALRWFGFGLLYASVVAAPLALLLFWRRREQRTLFALAALASALLLARGDVPQLRAAALAGAVFWLLLPVTSRRLFLPLRLAFCALLLVPALERSWLAAMHPRNSLVEWDEPRAGVLLAAPRAQRLDALIRDLRQQPGSLFIWPPTPGIHFLSQRALATRALLPNIGADSLGAEIAATQPSLALLAPSAIVGARALSSTEPSLIEELRLHYRWIGSMVGASEEFRALSRLGATESLDQLSLSERLPFAEMTVGNDLSPPLVPGFSIGQSLRMASTDLEGFSLRWSSPGGEQTVALRIWVWLQSGEERPVLLQFFDTEVRIAGDGHRSYLRFGPIDQTAGLDLALTLEVRAQPAHELRLWMHRHDQGGRRADFYRLGSALFHEEAVAADLVFAAY